MPTLAEIRAKLQQNSNNNSPADNAIYPHWDIQTGQTAVIRFLPDADQNNSFFWVERSMINLTFSGIKDDAASKPLSIQVPCMEMWGMPCPILTEVRPWFKDKNLEDLGRKYWKKRSYLFQGFVVDSKLQENKVPENPIRRFIINGQIFNIVKNALMDTEIEEIPTDYVRGLDFKIIKTSKGEYSDYSTSTWARRERALSADELAAIEKYGLFDLKEFLPKKPGEVELKVIKEMFEASVNGEAYDTKLWGSYYRPKGIAVNNNDETSNNDSGSSDYEPKQEVKHVNIKPVPAASNVDDEVLTTNAETQTDDSASARAKAILDAIRNRPR